MEIHSRDWSSSERREVLLLALLPLACAVVLTLSLFASNPGILLLAFIAATACAYVSLAIGVVPVLLLFKRLRWQGWLHFAFAGYAGVVLVWLVPVIAFGGLKQSPESTGLLPALVFLSLPGGIASAAAALFWFLCVHQRPTHNGV